jgi:hypothetical protein
VCRYCLTEGIHAGDVTADLSADGILVLTIRKLPQGLEFTERQLEQPTAEQLEQPAAEQLPGTGSRCARQMFETFSRKADHLPFGKVFLYYFANM